MKSENKILWKNVAKNAGEVIGYTGGCGIGFLGIGKLVSQISTIKESGLPIIPALGIAGLVLGIAIYTDVGSNSWRPIRQKPASKGDAFRA